ncbi:MAG: DUF1223 domain-containing protein [Acidobacteriaceae bacterium]
MDNRKIVTLMILALMATSALAQKVVLVELFTSEGCSSCPPADALLKLVNGSKTSGGELVVGISEHVTYWNSLGWSDPYSSDAYTERQNAYSERFHLDGVYTPQMVINGAEQIVGSDHAGLLHAVEQEDAESPRLSLRIMSVNRAANTLTVNFVTSGDVPNQGADLMAVLADDADRSNVLRGENSGRTLAHVSVARSITRVARVKTAGELTVQIPIPASFQANQGHHLILFAQTPGNGRVLGTDTKPL